MVLLYLYSKLASLFDKFFNIAVCNFFKIEPFVIDLFKLEDIVLFETVEVLIQGNSCLRS